MDNREVQELIDRVARLSRELREATKRLTDIKDILGDNYDLERLREAVTRQKEYEQFMERWKEAVKISGAVKDIGAERIAELVQADREGRCVVLPCKVGDIVYIVTSPINVGGLDFEKFEDEEYERKAMFECRVGSMSIYEGEKHIQVRLYHDGDFVAHYIQPDDFGKCVFLTRESAEKEMEMEGE